MITSTNFITDIYTGNYDSFTSRLQVILKNLWNLSFRVLMLLSAIILIIIIFLEFLFLQKWKTSKSFIFFRPFLSVFSLLNGIDFEEFINMNNLIEKLEKQNIDDIQIEQKEASTFNSMCDFALTQLFRLNFKDLEDNLIITIIHELPLLSKSDLQDKDILQKVKNNDLKILEIIKKTFSTLWLNYMNQLFSLIFNSFIPILIIITNVYIVDMNLHLKYNMIETFSPYMYKYKLNMVSIQVDKMNQARQLLIQIFEIIVIFLSEMLFVSWQIILKQYNFKSILDRFLLPIVIYVYCILYLTNVIKHINQKSMVNIGEDIIISNKYISRIYAKKCQKMTSGSMKNVSKRNFVIIFILIKIILFLIQMKKLNMNNINKYLFNFVAVTLMSTLQLMNFHLSSFHNLMYLLNTYDIFAYIVRDAWELNSCKNIQEINSVELYIKKYMYINTPNNFIKDLKDKNFIRTFNKILSYGDITGAFNYLNNCGNEELKNFLEKELKDEKNILLHNVGISLHDRTASYLIDQDTYLSLSSKTGRTVWLSAPSGSGKSTIIDCMIGDNSFLSSFINKHSSYLIFSESKNLIPVYNDKYDQFVDELSIWKNFQIVDSYVSINEITYLWNKMKISRYLNEINNEFSITSFSSGELSRMLISKVFINLNKIIKDSCNDIKDEDIKNEILTSLTCDEDDIDFEKISKYLKLKSFFVVLDEPVRALDAQLAKEVMKIIEKYKKFGFSFMIIDHSGIAYDYSDDKITICNKTCTYFTKVNGEFVDCKNLLLNDDNTLQIEDTIAYKTKLTKKIPSPGEIKQSYVNGEYDGISIVHM